MTRFFPSIQAIHTFSLNPVLTCPYCGRADQFVSHGFVYHKQECASPCSVGKRLVCSNRFGHSGCGRTVRLYLAESLPRLQVSATLMSLFILALLNGYSVQQAFFRVSGCEEPRQAWRWLRRLYAQLPCWRTRLSPTLLASPAPVVAPRSKRRHLVVQTLRSMLEVSSTQACARFQLRWQSAFC